jgi:hypothetical protein
VLAAVCDGDAHTRTHTETPLEPTVQRSTWSHRTWSHLAMMAHARALSLSHAHTHHTRSLSHTHAHHTLTHNTTFSSL